MSEGDDAHAPRADVSFAATGAFVRTFGAREAAQQGAKFNAPSWTAAHPTPPPPLGLHDAEEQRIKHEAFVVGLVVGVLATLAMMGVGYLILR